MNPQNYNQTSNKLADWVNESSSLEDAATRYNQVIHGGSSSDLPTLR